MKAEKLALPADAAPIEIDIAQLRVASQKIGCMSCVADQSTIRSQSGAGYTSP
jgi:hypothetical protein